MGNMGYCRFQNTLEDLKDCWRHIEDNDLSSDEAEARTDLLDICRRILEDAGVDDDQEDESLPEAPTGLTGAPLDDWLDRHDVPQ